MRITPVIEQLKQRCPSFENRVAGGLDWDPVKGSALMKLPAAYVIPTGDGADEPEQQNVIVQQVRDAIDVCVVLKNYDERGQQVADQLHLVRASLWRALVGFEPDKDYGQLLYDGGSLLLIDRDRVVYRFRFFADFQLGNLTIGSGTSPETWQAYTLLGLPPLEGVDTSFDFIDPVVDRNVAPEGPDGRIEIKTREDLSQ